MLSRIVLFSAAAVVVLGSAFLVGCSDGSGNGDTVVAAFYPIAFAAEQITDGTVGVRNLTPVGAEPHDLELTPGDIRAVHDARVVLYFGDGFMPGLERAVDDRSGLSVDLLSELRRQQGNGGGPPHDPHVWLDPVLYASLVRLIGNALGDEAATIPLTRKLTQLDAEYRRGLAHCARRQIVTSHAAFEYLARRYGLVQVPLEGLTPEAEPSAGDIGRLVDTVRRSGTTTVFSETLISPKLAQTVAREAGVAHCRPRPARGAEREQDQGRRRLFHGHAGEPGRASEGPRMHGVSQVVELHDVSFHYRAGASVLEDVSSPLRRASSSRSPGRTGAARRLCSGSCSASSGRRQGPCGSSAALPARAHPEPASATCPSARGSSARHP